MVNIYSEDSLVEQPAIEIFKSLGLEILKIKNQPHFIDLWLKFDSNIGLFLLF